MASRSSSLADQPRRSGGSTARLPLLSRLDGRAGASAGLVVVLALAVLVGFLPLWTLPSVVPASAPAAEFSAERAMRELEAIARAPRPLGSAENARVREYLVAQIRALGLEPEVQTTTAVNRFPEGTSFSVGTVSNVVVRIPGTASTGAIALDAHYDGAATGPGASDCGSCVVALLETMRAVKAGPALRNDVVFVFTDGEENQDIGAAAFVAEHPLARDVRLALNFETMAAGGPAVMYYTSGGNGWLIEEFARSTPLPLTSSFVVALMRLFPSQQLGCDLDEFVEAGVQGLGFVFYADDIPAYHTMRDNVANTDPRSVQHDGLYALSAVRHFGNLDLSASPRTSDAVFFNVLPGVLAHYAAALALPLAVVVGLLFVAALALGLRRGKLSAGGLVVGALALPLGTFALVALAGAVWAGVRSANPNLQPFQMGNQSGLYLLGLSGLIAAGQAALYVALSRRVRVDNLAVGGIFLWTVLAVVTAVALPPMSYLFAWPTLFALLAVGWLLSRPSHPTDRAALVALSLGAVPALVLVPQALQLVAPLFVRLDALMGAASGIPLLEAPLVLLGLLGGLLVTQLAFVGGLRETTTSRHRWLVPAAALLVGVCAIGLATVRSGFGPAFPQPTSVAYQLDADTGRAVWLSLNRERDAWTSTFLPADADSTSDEGFPFLGIPSTAYPAPSVPLPAPEVRLVSDATSGGLRTVRLHLGSPRQAYAMQVIVEAPGEIVEATIDGKGLGMDDLSATERRGLMLSYYGLPSPGADLVVRLREEGPLRVTVQDATPGLPSVDGTPITQRPAGLMPSPGPTVLDPTVVRRTLTLG